MPCLSWTKKSTENETVQQTATSLLNPIAPIPKERERSVSKIIGKREEITTAKTTIGGHPTTGIRHLTCPIATKMVPKDPANIVKAKIMPQTNAEHVLSVKRLENFARSAEVTLPTIYTKKVYARGPACRQKHFSRPTNWKLDFSCWSPKYVHSDENLWWSHNRSDKQEWSNCVVP